MSQLQLVLIIKRHNKSAKWKGGAFLKVSTVHVAYHALNSTFLLQITKQVHVDFDGQHTCSSVYVLGTFTTSLGVTSIKAHVEPTEGNPKMEEG